MLAGNTPIDLLTHLRSMGTTKRHFLRPEGWSKIRSTAFGNRLARRLAYLSVTQERNFKGSDRIVHGSIH